jgi:hypothetical protein
MVMMEPGLAEDKYCNLNLSDKEAMSRPVALKWTLE